MTTRRKPSTSTAREVRFAAIGDVHGSFGAVAALVDLAKRDLSGSMDAVLCVGDMEANRNARDAAGVATGKGHRRWVGEFPKVVSGEIEIGAPLWFIGGDHEPWARLDSRGPGEVVPGVTFLGRAGVRDVCGLRVAFLSGVRGAASEGDLFSRGGRDERACYVDIEIVALQRSMRRHESIDVLLTHDWPEGLDGDTGSADVRSLLDVTTTSLHICGHHHIRKSGAIGVTQIEALADVTSGADGYATFVKRRDGSIERVS